MNHDSYPDSYIANILHSVKSIAMIGASAKDVRPSYIAMKYLLAKGYEVHPVNPGQAGKEILGQMTYARLSDVPAPIDMVDVFRGSDALPAIVDEVLKMEPRPGVIWAQLTVRNDEAAAKAEAAGLKVVMNRCPKIEYGRHSGEIGWNGVNSRIISSKKPVLQSGYQALGIRTRPQ
ncbi:CoA-binding protein [Hoeflea poritis]|uniref:CoA-binding protein n=1 Tax=Hoeflea poritis TaxID=2993659 RepID=A0ABT4VQ57_9HYPH|nr:CoA-binding protein [Hoeflea poritis]MDA4846835.1 CoA-binding protein [Hoeflea poritis]